MKRRAVLLLCASLLVGCGPYRMTYRVPSQEGKDKYWKTELHSHAIGPFLIGGGGFFFIFSQMSPALINYTGKVDARDVCPDGFLEVSHHHDIWQHIVAALISWGGFLNWWHPSYAEWTCVRPEGYQTVPGLG